MVTFLFAVALSRTVKSSTAQAGGASHGVGLSALKTTDYMIALWHNDRAASGSCTVNLITEDCHSLETSDELS